MILNRPKGREKNDELDNRNRWVAVVVVVRDIPAFTSALPGVL